MVQWKSLPEQVFNLMINLLMDETLQKQEASNEKRFGQPPTSTLDMERVQKAFELSPRTSVRRNWLFQG